MDQAQQWTWAKRKHGLMIGATTTNISSHDHPDLIGQRVLVKASYDHDSWEEQAFAEDSSGPLGGCIWPPRSYSCSFCRREFRSAQALGGHMNVHRRDRARLKQSQPSDLQREIAPYPTTHDHIISPLMMNNGDGTNSTIGSTSQIPKFPSLVYNPNPNSDPKNNLITPTISPPPPLQVRHEYDSSSSSFHLQENNHSKWSKDNASTPWSNLASTSTITDKITYSLNNKASQRLLDLHGDHKVSSITVESGGTCRPINNNNNNNNNHYHHASDLSVSLNLVVCRSCPTTTMSSTGYNNQEDHHHHQNLFGSCKRRKTTDTDDNSDNVNCLRSKVFDDRVSPSCSIEELDLELRLGNGPSHIIR